MTCFITYSYSTCQHQLSFHIASAPLHALSSKHEAAPRWTFSYVLADLYNVCSQLAFWHFKLQVPDDPLSPRTVSTSSCTTVCWHTHGCIGSRACCKAVHLPQLSVALNEVGTAVSSVQYRLYCAIQAVLAAAQHYLSIPGCPMQRMQLLWYFHCSLVAYTKVFVTYAAPATWAPGHQVYIRLEYNRWQNHIRYS